MWGVTWWIHLTIVLAVAASVLQLAGFLAPMWIWLDVGEFNVGVGLWDSRGCGLQPGGCEGETPNVSFGYTTDDLWPKSGFSVVRALETLGVVGTVLLLLFLVIYRVGYHQWTNMTQLNLAACVTAILTWLFIVVGLMVFCGEFWPIVGTSPLLSTSSFPWSLLLCLLAALLLVLVSVLIRLKCRERSAHLKHAIPISGDANFDAHPLTKHGIMHRFFQPLHKGLRGFESRIAVEQDHRVETANHAYAMNTRLVGAEERHVAAIDNRAFYDHRLSEERNDRYPGRQLSQTPSDNERYQSNHARNHAATDQEYRFQRNQTNHVTTDNEERYERYASNHRSGLEPDTGIPRSLPTAIVTYSGHYVDDHHHHHHLQEDPRPERVSPQPTASPAPRPNLDLLLRHVTRERRDVDERVTSRHDFREQQQQRGEEVVLNAATVRQDRERVYHPHQREQTTGPAHEATFVAVPHPLRKATRVPSPLLQEGDVLSQVETAGHDVRYTTETVTTTTTRNVLTQEEGGGEEEATTHLPTFHGVFDSRGQDQDREVSAVKATYHGRFDNDQTQNQVEDTERTVFYHGRVDVGRLDEEQDIPQAYTYHGRFESDRQDQQSEVTQDHGRELSAVAATYHGRFENQDQLQTQEQETAQSITYLGRSQNPNQQQQRSQEQETTQTVSFHGRYDTAQQLQQNTDEVIFYRGAYDASPERPPVETTAAAFHGTHTAANRVPKQDGSAVPNTTTFHGVYLEEGGEGDERQGAKAAAYQSRITKTTTTSYVTEDGREQRDGELRVTDVKLSDGQASAHYYTATNAPHDHDDQAVKPYDGSYIYRALSQEME